MICQTPKPKGFSSIPSLVLYYICIEDNTLCFSGGWVLVLVREPISMEFLLTVFSLLCAI